MIRLGPLRFREIWLVDFEFSAPSGERPTPICAVAWELGSGQRLKIWQHELQKMRKPPYAVGADSLFVAYYASAEMGCHLVLGWPLPENVLDLFTEFRNLTNGLALPCGRGLLGAQMWFGLNGIDALEKEDMRALAIRGGPYTLEEHHALLDYCESDVVALAKLLPKMAPMLDMPRALLRGRYMKAAARIEHYGVPIDTKALECLRSHWDDIQDNLIESIDADYGVYEGRTFKAARFAEWLSRNDIPWPRLESGALNLSDDVFRQMARTYPIIAPLRELRWSLSQMRLSELAVGRDGRNRSLLSAFQARTGRNQPSSNRFIFGTAVWLRGLIRPQPGYGLALIDWSQQEFGIAAALSGDALMIEAYESGDPYLEFAKQAGAVPSGAAIDSHRSEREQFKACALAIQYGMEATSLGLRLGVPTARARELLRLHRETYRGFWRWSDRAVDYAMLNGQLYTAFGWTVRVGDRSNPRFLRNFPMQGNGAEMLRIACCLATELGIHVCAPVHDAILIEAPLEELKDTVVAAKQAMSDASAIVLNGFRLRSEAKIIRYPERYMDERGAKMWATVWGILERLDSRSTFAPAHTPDGRARNITCAGAHTRPILLSSSNES